MRRTLLAAVVLMAGLAAAETAHAQGTFYREVAKDGRIYVFNDMVQFQAWEISGEMGVAITLLGYGPSGETMVFDSEEAIHLYNFKHDRPGDPRPRPKPTPPSTITWKDGATTLQFPNAKVKVSNRMQIRYTHELPDDDVQLGGTAEKGDDRGSFRLRRMKTKVDGWVYQRWIEYELQLNWVAVGSSNTGSMVEDMNMNLDLSPEHDRRFMVKLGQFKYPQGLQELTSSGSQQFVDRSAVSNTYSAGRDAGLQVWGQLWNNRIEYRAGVFNGNGLTRSANDNDAFLWAARLVLQPNGEVPLGSNSNSILNEPGFETVSRPIWAVGLSFQSNDLHRATTSVDQNDTTWGLDGLFKYKGFSARAEYYLRDREPEPATAGAPVVRFEAPGWFAQAGYLFGAKRRWEIAARYGSIDPTDQRDDDEQTELRGGASYYHNKHALKVQADFGRLKNKANGHVNHELRIQTQVLF